MQNERILAEYRLQLEAKEASLQQRAQELEGIFVDLQQQKAAFEEEKLQQPHVSLPLINWPYAYCQDELRSGRFGSDKTNNTLCVSTIPGQNRMDSGTKMERIYKTCSARSTHAFRGQVKHNNHFTTLEQERNGNIGRS